MITYPTKDGYTTQVDVLYCVYHAVRRDDGLVFERIAGLFDFESEAVEFAQSIRLGVRIAEILRLPEVSVR